MKPNLIYKERQILAKAIYPNHKKIGNLVYEKVAFAENIIQVNNIKTALKHKGFSVRVIPKILKNVEVGYEIFAR